MRVRVPRRGPHDFDWAHGAPGGSRWRWSSVHSILTINGVDCRPVHSWKFQPTYVDRPPTPPRSSETPIARIRFSPTSRIHRLCPARHSGPSRRSSWWRGGMQNPDVGGEPDSCSPNLSTGAEEAAACSLVQEEAGVLRDPESHRNRRDFPPGSGEDRLRWVAEEETPL